MICQEHAKTRNTRNCITCHFLPLRVIRTKTRNTRKGISCNEKCEIITRKSYAEARRESHMPRQDEKIICRGKTGNSYAEARREIPYAKKKAERKHKKNMCMQASCSRMSSRKAFDFCKRLMAACAPGKRDGQKTNQSFFVVNAFFVCCVFCVASFLSDCMQLFALITTPHICLSRVFLNSCFYYLPPAALVTIALFLCLFVRLLAAGPPLFLPLLDTPSTPL